MLCFDNRNNFLDAALEMPQAVLSNEALSAREDSTVARNSTRQHGMVLPFEPLSVTFEDIIYAVDMPKVSSTFCKGKQY